LINYGNGTSQWINRTNIPSSWNFYDLTNNITKVQAMYYGPPTSEHLVTGINGVHINGQYFWSLWAVCQKSKAWIATSVGADAIHFTTYHTLAWFYQAANSQDSSNWNPPVAGAAKVTMCLDSGLTVSSILLHLVFHPAVECSVATAARSCHS